MVKTVDEIRRQIDSMDDKIHDLLMKRAALVQRIGQEKHKNNVQIIQPDRETVMIRRLLARHEGLLPKEAVVRIWRELVGAVSLLQTGIKVAVTVPEDPSGLLHWDMAKDYFSSVLPMQKVTNPLGVVAMVREGEATFGVLPWPEDTDKAPWWYYLADDLGEKPMRIVGRVPLGDRNHEAPDSRNQALVVARLSFEESGEDRSFLALILEKPVSRSLIVEKAKALNLTARSLHSFKGEGLMAHLLEVDDFMAADDKRLKELLDSLDSLEGRCVYLGGYPVPPVYEDHVGKNAVAGG